jgi:hypothetical protein
VDGVGVSGRELDFERWAVAVWVWGCGCGRALLWPVRYVASCGRGGEPGGGGWVRCAVCLVPVTFKANSFYFNMNTFKVKGK